MGKGRTPKSGEQPLRLDRYLSEALGLSRAESRRCIAAGRVTLAGQVCRQAETHVLPPVSLAVDGRPVTGWQPFVCLMLNKPAGVLSASRDARVTTVVDLAAGACPRRALFPAGRLDKDSTGLVLLTDDGALAHALLAPGRHVPKVYRVRLDAPLTAAMCAGFAAGVVLADGTRLAPAEAEAVGEEGRLVQVTLHQGVYHQIKRMFGVYGAGVEALHRLSIGPLQLDPALAAGEWRPLTAAEEAALRAAAAM